MDKFMCLDEIDELFLLQLLEARSLLKYKDSILKEFMDQLEIADCYLPKFKFGEAFQEAISLSMLPIDCWWVVSGLTGVAFLGAFAFPATIMILLSGLVSGFLYFYYSYHKSQNEYQAEKDAIRLLSVKSLVLDELIKRKKCQLDRELIPEYKHEQISLDKKNNVSKIKSFSVGASLIVAMEFSYLYGVTSLFETLGYVAIASILTGPFGLGLALAIGLSVVAVGLGFYIGYLHYQDQKNENTIKNNKSELKNVVKCKKKYFEKLQQEKEKVVFAEKYVRNSNLLFFPSAAVKRSSSDTDLRAKTGSLNRFVGGSR